MDDTLECMHDYEKYRVGSENLQDLNFAMKQIAH